MRDNDVGIVERLVEIERGPLVAPQLDVGHKLRGLRQTRAAALFLQGVLSAPAGCRLVNGNVMTKSDELACDAAEEMCIAVVPAREEGMIEQDKFHGAVPENSCCTILGMARAASSSY